MKMDRSGKTLQDYRQLYWDGQKRIDELEERLKFNQENHDALVARWEPHIAELEETNRAYKEAWSVNILTDRIVELEATIKKVEAVGFEVHNSWGTS